MQGRAHDRHQETIVNIINQLLLHQRVSYLNDCIAELKGTHEECKGRHSYPVFPAQAVPIIPRNLNLSRQ